MKAKRVLCLWMFFMLAGAIGAAAQDTSSALATGIVGMLSDAQGAVIASATVSLTSNVAPTQIATTDTDGKYEFRALRPGNYVVIISLPGFNDYKSAEIALIGGLTERLDIKLEVAGTKTSIEVSGNAPRVETEDPTVSNTLSAKELTGYQLNGRNFTQLIALAPGVSNQTGQDEAKVGVQGSAAFSVNGGRTEYNSFDLDGSDLLNVGFNGSVNTLVVYPSLDAIGEMKVLTSNYGAMYGRTASGTVLVSTKSGSTDFHGDGYLFMRNEKLNARNFFDETKGAPLYRRADMGWTIGGPLYIPGVYNQKKDKTFFFFSEEYRNEKSPYEFNQAVPSAAERKGNFNDVCPSARQLITPDGGGNAGFNRAQYPDCPAQENLGLEPVNGQYVPFSVPYYKNQLFDNNHTFLNRNAAIILGTGILPLPNSNSGCNSTINSCYVSTVSVPTHWHEELFRIDHYFNEKNRLLIRFVHDSWSTVTPTPQFGIVQNNVPTVENNFVGPGVAKVVRFSQTLAPTLLNEVFFSYTNSVVTLTDTNGPNAQWQRPAGLDAPCQLVQYPGATTNECPLGSLFNNGFGGKMPGLVFTGDPAYGGGFGVDSGYMPWYHSNPVYSFGDSMTKQWGQHLLHFGSEFIVYNRTQTNSVSGAATGDTQGILTYNTNGTGNAFADFLLENGSANSPQGNVPYSYQQDSAQGTYHQRYEIAEPYLQDDWKVSPRLTLNLGLRASLFGQYHTTGNNVYNFIPNAFNSVLASQIQIDPYQGFLESSGVNTSGQFNPVYLDPANLDPHLTNGLVRCGQNGVPASCMSSHLFNPAPRVGFAWDPTGKGKTSVRGGYGLFFEHGTGNEANTGALEGSAPLVLSATVYNPSDVSCIGEALAACGGNGGSFAYPLNVTSIPTKTVWPYVQQWSFSLQRELPRNTIATVAYVGSKGTHLTAEQQTNEIPALRASQNPYGPNQPILTQTGNFSDCGPNFDPVTQVQALQLSNGAYVDQGSPAYTNLAAACVGWVNSNTRLAQFPTANGFRPYLGMGQIVALSNTANSSYNALQATARHQEGDFTIALAYTYSHSLDDSSDRFDPVPNAYNLRSNWASSNFDQRNLLNISYIYDLPFLKWAAIANKVSGWGRDALEGWELSGITVYQTGSPFSVVNDGDIATGVSVADNAGVAGGLGIGSYPDIVSNPYSKAPAGGNNGSSFGPLLLNPAAFVAPRGLTFGDAGRNALNNPNRVNFDLSVFKTFRISEKQSVQFRAEAFNVFNNTQFEIYNSIRGNQPNNTITCYGGVGSGYSAAGGGGTDCLTGSAFLHPIDAHRPRTMQIAVKFFF